MFGQAECKRSENQALFVLYLPHYLDIIRQQFEDIVLPKIRCRFSILDYNILGRWEIVRKLFLFISTISRQDDVVWDESFMDSVDHCLCVSNALAASNDHLFRLVQMN